jgi:hypothetical protein
MNALKLNLDKEYIKEYHLIGIACHLKDYRLIYNINKVLGCDLKKQEDLVFCPAKDKLKINYSFYSYSDDNIEYYILSNRNPDGILIAEQKQIDYILIIKGQINNQHIRSVINSVSTIPSVLMTYEIKPESVKNLDLILSDLELHLIELTRIQKGK